jgi:hypothetical protein
MTDPQLEIGLDGPSTVTHDRQDNGAEGVVRLQLGAEMDARPQQVDSATAPSDARWGYGPSPHVWGAGVRVMVSGNGEAPCRSSRDRRCGHGLVAPGRRSCMPGV